MKFCISMATRFAGVFSVCLLTSPLFVGTLSAAGQKNQPSVKPQMNQIYSAMSAILPLAYDPAGFASTENAKAILESLTVLESVSHELEMGKKNIPLDPFNRMISRGLKNDLVAARQLFTDGEKNLSRDLVRGITGYCIGCHTSSSRGSWNFPGADVSAVKTLSPVDKATYLAAIRRYDESIIYYEKALIELGSQQRSPDQAQAWQLAVKRMLAIIIRVQDNPFLALELVSRIREEGSVPAELLQASAQWRKSIKEWNEEGKPGAKRATRPVERARLLVSAGEKLASGNAPDAGLIPYLRASRIVNELLRTKQLESDTGELLYLGGLIAQKTDAINFWTLDLGYFEACIRFSPKSPLSKKCFEKYEVGLSSRKLTSSGRAPDIAADRVKELRKLAGG